MTTAAITWACPECKAPHGKHGAGECESRGSCDGFVCDCDDYDSGKDHGVSFADVCHHAFCNHCGWEGMYPQKPKGLQAWERKALDAGWTPPAERQREMARAK